MIVWFLRSDFSFTTFSMHKNTILRYTFINQNLINETATKCNTYYIELDANVLPLCGIRPNNFGDDHFAITVSVHL